MNNLERLRAEIKIGLDQLEAGDVGTLDIEKIKAEGRKRIEQRKSKRAD